MFNEKAAANVAVYLLHKNGGPMSILKLMKLMYLGERATLAKYAVTITGDNFVSMPHGPVLSATLDRMNGFVESQPGGWDDWIAARANHKISIKPGVSFDAAELPYLSRVDMEALDAVWDKFGDMSALEIRDYTHRHCAEWRDPNGSSAPIPIERVLRAVGYNATEVKNIAARLEEENGIAEFFARNR